MTSTQGGKIDVRTFLEHTVLIDNRCLDMCFYAYDGPNHSPTEVWKCFGSLLVSLGRRSVLISMFAKHCGVCGEEIARASDYLGFKSESSAAYDSDKIRAIADSSIPASSKRR
jgi:hypothetical protein